MNHFSTNMFYDISVLKCVFLVFIFAVKTVYPLSCGIKGLCQGAALPSQISESLDSCVLADLWLKWPGCLTNPENGICSTLEDCWTVSTEVPFIVNSEGLFCKRSMHRRGSS